MRESHNSKQVLEKQPSKPLVVTENLERLLAWTTSIGHIIISIALILAVLVVATHFFVDMYKAIQDGNLFSGFIRSLAVMLLLWTMLELVQTERGFLRGEPIDVSLFVEVAIVVIVREIILLPIEQNEPTFEAVAKWSLAAVLLGLTYFFLRFSRKQITQQ